MREAHTKEFMSVITVIIIRLNWEEIISIAIPLVFQKQNIA